MTPLKSIISAQIAKFGPMTVADYMTLCLLHPKHGYYMQADPFGAGGDFTTAPEISQMFGELLGLCLAQSWQDQGRPAPFALCELGPGRGTLMADMLRAATRVPRFVEAAQIWLVEASPVLQKMQAGALRGHSPNWAPQVAALPDLPLFLIANEFFDALPVRQYRHASGGWQEQMIGLVDGELAFGLTSPLKLETLDDQSGAVKSGDIVEINTATQGIVADIAARIANRGGAALIVDYGHWGQTGDTFQAVKSHRKVNPLQNPGLADLTAHVDFAALVRAARGVSTTKLTDQGLLLGRLGITARTQALASQLRGKPLDDHISAYRRLTHADEMGTLFKAIALHAKGSPPPPGFEP